eukprot:TRINITY_DN12435_c0_g1_i1.p1 TRINITY_DN12435_c0_g1~~TRINITY_DN12435_c0_g1_i1.p1  ORF type:complete len:231 (-),score=59.69 TRINITY_DN12435_c0_g1_i1:320-1012(-)
MKPLQMDKLLILGAILVVSALQFDLEDNTYDNYEGLREENDDDVEIPEVNGGNDYNIEPSMQPELRDDEFGTYDRRYEGSYDAAGPGPPPGYDDYNIESREDEIGNYDQRYEGSSGGSGPMAPSGANDYNIESREAENGNYDPRYQGLAEAAGPFAPSVTNSYEGSLENELGDNDYIMGSSTKAESEFDSYDGEKQSSSQVGAPLFPSDLYEGSGGNDYNNQGELEEEGL